MKRFQSLKQVRLHLISKGALINKRGDVLQFNLKKECFDYGVYQHYRYEILETEWTTRKLITS